MSNLTVFHFESNEVRVVLIENEPWFIGADICKILDINNYSDAYKRLRDYEIKTIDSIEGVDVPTQNIVSESGLYRLALTSRKPKAEPFQDWVCQDVIPSIRKTGQYSVNQAKEQLENQFLPDVPLKQIDELGQMMGKLYGEAYQQRLVQLNVKKFYPHFSLPDPAPEEKASLPTEALLTPTQIAEELGVYYSTGNPNPREINKRLCELGYQEKIGGVWSATEKAKGLCDRKPVDTNSRSQKDQLLWSRKILDVLREHFVK